MNRAGMGAGGVGPFGRGNYNNGVGQYGRGNFNNTVSLNFVIILLTI